MSTLTPTQREVFELARERGYYQWLHGVSTRELAAELDVSKTTMLEHPERPKVSWSIHSPITNLGTARGTTVRSPSPLAHAAMKYEVRAPSIPAERTARPRIARRARTEPDPIGDGDVRDGGSITVLSY